MSKKTIMIADNDPGIVDVLTLMLEDAGYEVETTDDGQTVKDIEEHLPDLILLDIWMAGFDGRDICKYLKSQKLTKHIPIIMISANKDAEEIAKEAGADDLLAKPFEMSNLLTIIEKHLKQNE